jgi:GNAT superfamily N-acetyltransferase
MSIEISEVDPADEDAIRDFYEVYLACGRHEPASFVAAPYEAVRGVIRQPTEDFRYTAFLARDHGAAVGQGWYSAFRRANRDKAIGIPRILPEHRRRGIGSAVLARLEQRARTDGRSVLQAGSHWAMKYGPDGTGSPGVEFARRHGYPVLLVEARRRLALPVRPELLGRLAARPDPAYEIRAFAGPVPQDLVQGWAELEASLPTEAPGGAVETEEFPPSVAAVRADERRGYGLKAAVIGLLQQEQPDVPAAITSNALSNAAMVAVNDQLGYQVVEYLGGFEKRLTP